VLKLNFRLKGSEFYVLTFVCWEEDNQPFKWQPAAADPESKKI